MNSVPPWLKKRVTFNDDFYETKKIISDLSLNTVCESARCPNIGECFSDSRATFMILGSICTRACSFCSVAKGDPAAIDFDEPARIADCVQRLGLKYAVITSVTRDDLPDGGADQFVNTVAAVRSASKDTIIELLVPDFAGRRESVEAIAMSGADIIGHNIETVDRLYPVARNGAAYRRSLDLLRLIKDIKPIQTTKSSIIAGLGENEDEIIETMRDLRAVSCDLLTIGQYLKPDRNSISIERFVTPEEFDRYVVTGKAMGFKNVSAGPFVRSSYRAQDDYNKYEGVNHDKRYAAAVS